MITTNLSTRPFYNERLVRTVLAIVAALVLAVTALNVWAIGTLSRTDRRQNAEAGRAEKKTQQARESADRIRRSINTAELQAATAAAVEANQLIGERTFSWTRLLSDFEKTLPPDVRVTTIRPGVDTTGTMVLEIGVVARRDEDVNEFVEKLEAQGFSDVVPRSEAVNAEGLRDILLAGRYAGVARRVKTR